MTDYLAPVRQGEPHSFTCRICLGPRSIAIIGERPSGRSWWGEGIDDRFHVHACPRCDTSEDGSGEGPPVFMKIWGSWSR